MTKAYTLIFNEKGLNDADFIFLSEHGQELISKLLNNKTALYHDNVIGTGTAVTVKDRMINWLRYNAIGY